MVVSHNIPALFSHLSMRRADRSLQSAMMRLSSGIRINSARDDAAGLAIANKLSYQVAGLNRASDNATHGTSLIQTAEGALNEVHNMLQRMRELAVQAANDTLTNDQKAMIQQEIDELTSEIHLISSRTEFNRMRILNGEADRVTRSLRYDNGDMVTTRGVTTTLFLSQAIQPGSLLYTIESAGQHAVAGFTMPTDMNAPFEFPLLNNPGPPYVPHPTDVNTMSMMVNGIRVTAHRGDTVGDVMGRLNTVLTHAGIDIQVSGDGEDAFLVTNLAGRDQHISIGRDTHSDFLIDFFGLTEIADATAAGDQPRGSDAVITLYELQDTNGNAVSGSAALSVSARGNQVSIRGPQGEDIRLNIQVRFCPNEGGHVFGDGSIAAGSVVPNPAYIPAGPAGTYNPGAILNPDYVGLGGDSPHEWYNPTAIGDPFLPPQEPLDMQLDIRNFGPIMLQIGPSHNTAMPVQIPRVNAETLGLIEHVAGVRRPLLNYRNTAGATNAINVTDRAIETVSLVRSRLGAYQNRLESTIRSLDVAAENTEISRSRIQDTDMARESTRLAQYNVIFQSAMAILTQANQRPQQLISMLQ